jgi:hypothetical protein
MRVIGRALWTEPVLFLSAVGGVFTLGGAIAAQVGAPGWLAIVCAVLGPAIAASARAKAWSPRSVHDLAARAQRVPMPESLEPPT